MKFIIGKKIEMTQIWQGEKAVAVTKVLAGPCPVVQLKTEKSDGYTAVQLGFDLRKEKNIKKPQAGHLKKAGAQAKDKKNLKYLREFRDEVKSLKVGDLVNVSVFQAGDIIKVTGASKGKGFQGGVKRHGWHGHNTTHGTKDQVRTSGSIGAGGIQHVLKGKRMSGRMGNERVTTSNLKIAQVDEANNILYISGAVPGARNGVLLIYGEGELKITPSASLPAQAGAGQAEVKEEAKIEPVKVQEKSAPSVSSGQAEAKAEIKIEPAKTEVKAEKVDIKKEELKPTKENK